MINFFVKRPVTTIMFVLFWVALGIVAFPRMNVESRPAIDFPMVTATFVYPGASPAEIESGVVKRAEDAMSEVAGLKKITTQIFENGAFVMTEFNIGVNVNEKASEIKAKIDALANEFPSDMKKPVVEKLNPLQESVIDIVISGADPMEMDRFVKDVLSQQITALHGVASVSVFGGRERAARIALNPELMAAHGASILDVIGTLGANNVSIPGGKIESGGDSNIVRFVGEFSDIKDIASLRISTIEGGIFKLSEIATVTDMAREIENGARYNGADVIIVSVVKASDGNAVKISKDIRKNFSRFELLMKDYFKGSDCRVQSAINNDKNVNDKSIGAADTTSALCTLHSALSSAASPQMQIVSDSSVAIQHETDNTIRDIFIGLMLTILTLLFFTREWRTTIIAGIMIPASLVAGLFWMDFSGFTLNSMTLLAIATALGTLIMDAIILIESANAMIQKGYAPEDAAVLGTKKVTVRIFATIGVHVVVFLPLAFMSGIAGQFMKQFGLSVVYLVLLSSMFSFTLTPMMIAKILRKKESRKIEKAKNKKSKISKSVVSTPDSRLPTNELSWFRKFYDYQLAHPWRVIGLSFIILALSIIPMRWVGNEFAPNTDVDEISIIVRGPVGTAYSRSEQIAMEVEKRLSEFAEVKSTSVKIGDRGTQNIAVKVGLVPRSERNLSDKKLVQQILPKLADIPGVEIQISAGLKMSGNMSDLVLRVTGPDDARRDEYAAKIIDVLNKIPEIQSALLAAQAPGDELCFVPDSDKMKYWGVQNQTAAASLRAALYGNDSYRYKKEGTEYPIIIEMSKEFKTRAMFESAFVSTPKGLIALSELGAVEYRPTSSDIRRVDKQRITEININLGKSTIGPMQKKIETELKNIDFAPGYGTYFGGMSEIQSESANEMMNAFLLATILTYIVLAAIMNSFVHPFTIATSILFSFAGVFLMLFLTGASMNIAAMLSIVMLVGLAVNNNILLLEPTIVRIKNGEDAKKVLWSEYIDKKRMILMTTIAVVAGIVPQLWSADGMKVSMAAVIVGGMLASLFWTFAMTPAVFMAMERLRKKTSKK